VSGADVFLGEGRYCELLKDADSVSWSREWIYIDAKV